MKRLLVTKLQGYTEGYYQLAIYALIAGLLLIVVSPLIRINAGSQINTNINQILLYVYNNYRRSLKQNLFGHPVGLFILSYRNVGAFSYYDESLLVLYMTSSTLGDDARGAGLGWTSQSFSIIRMVYHVSIHNVNTWRNDCG
jgi:hypothetical protein